MAARRYRARRGLAIVLGLAAAALYVAIAFVAVWSPELSTARALTYVAAAIVWTSMSTIGVVIATRGVRTAGSTMLALAIAAASFNSTLEDVHVLFGAAKPPWLFWLDLASGFIAAGAYVRSSQLFPRVLTEDDMLSPQATWARTRWPQRALAALLRPWAAWTIAAAWLAASTLAAAVIGALANVGLILIGAAFWRVHIRVGNATVRRRVAWILQTVLVFAMMYLIITTLMTLLRAAGVGIEERSWVFIAYSILLAVGGCGSMGMAVFSAGAFNPSLVVRSTVVYGTAISLLLFALNVITSAMVDSAADALGLNDRLVAATLGAIAGLLLEPLARGLRRLLKRATPRLNEEKA